MTDNGLVFYSSQCLYGTTWRNLSALANENNSLTLEMADTSTILGVGARKQPWNQHELDKTEAQFLA